MELLHQAEAQQMLVTATYVDRNRVTAEHQFFILEFNEGSDDPGYGLGNLRMEPVQQDLAASRSGT